ncbi:hypothetical protein B0H21DRAFT_818874 [Amylocystis lapponica]|nr:hypothetical protein B0H21DRAFT_818874 [Amylocystis lapponica]
MRLASVYPRLLRLFPVHPTGLPGSRAPAHPLPGIESRQAAVIMTWDRTRDDGQWSAPTLASPSERRPSQSIVNRSESGVHRTSGQTASRIPRPEACASPNPPRLMPAPASADWLAPHYCTTASGVCPARVPAHGFRGEAHPRWLAAGGHSRPAAGASICSVLCVSRLSTNVRRHGIAVFGAHPGHAPGAAAACARGGPLVEAAAALGSRALAPGAYRWVFWLARGVAIGGSWDAAPTPPARPEPGRMGALRWWEPRRAWPSAWVLFPMRTILPASYMRRRGT